MGHKIMAKKKTTAKAKEKEKDVPPKEDFQLETALLQVNPLLLDGFKKFIQDKDVKTMKEFKKYYEIYGGVTV